MLDLVGVATVAMATVAILLSAVSLVVHWQKRAEHPATAPLQLQIEALQLGQADIIDRVDHWMRRSSSRKLREALGEPPSVTMERNNDEQLQPQAQPELPLATSPQQLKAQLRQVARSQGHRI
jgi:hypothetical protein